MGMRIQHNRLSITDITMAAIIPPDKSRYVVYAACERPVTIYVHMIYILYDVRTCGISACDIRIYDLRIYGI